MKVQDKPDYLIFAGEAKTGEIENFPDVLRGWGVTIDQTQSKPPLEWMNSAFNRVDMRTLYLIQHGIPEWDKSISYPANAVTKYNGVLYTAIVANDNATPSTSTTKWKKTIADVQDASTTKKGVVQLSSATDSDSETQAATSKAVKDACSKASDALSKTATALQTVVGKTNFSGGLQSGGVDVLKVGDGGVLSLTGGSITDFSAHLKGGFFGFNSSSLTGNPSPYPSSSACLAVFPTNYQYWKMEMLSVIGGGTPVVYFRNDTSSGKGSWVECVHSANIANYAVGLGINQTWQDVTNQRAFGVTYTNTTNNPIMFITSQDNAPGYTLTAYVDDVVVGKVSFTSDWGNKAPVSVIVPAGGAYRVESTYSPSPYFWSELR